MIRWAILTGEYPPQAGGVSDYTALIARRLTAEGDTVHVFAPATTSGAELADPGVTVHRLPGQFGPRSLTILDRLLSTRPLPDRILVQYVPHAFGFKAMNLLFAVWIASRARRLAPVWVMFHEVAFPFSWRPLKHVALGATTHVMARLLAGAADRVFVSVPAWGQMLKWICSGGRGPEWLPVPCTLETDPAPEAVGAVRSQVARVGMPLVGHFGTFGCLVADLLVPALLELLRLAPNTRILLVGRGSVEFATRFKATHPEWTTRVEATGGLPAQTVSAHLQACDVLIQPFPDGVSSRRTSAMAGLANGVPVVTNLGFLSEPLWACHAVVAAPTPDPIAIAKLGAALLADPVARTDLGRRAVALYRNTFAVEHTIAKLREAQ
ncbi:MAG: hypothetical protein K8U57_07775 [Planctomycetes bacterium]|nr:hypothetical protein [Planctomycetota bacterium]